MNGILYIEKLFQNILTNSKAIQGRVFYAPRYGSELDTDNLQLLIDECVNSDINKKDYPLALIMPPTIESNSHNNYVEVSELSDVLKGAHAEKRIYSIAIMFVQKSFSVTGTGPNGEPVNVIRDINKNRNTSKHRIVEDWHDMDLVARDFVRVLAGWIVQNNKQGKISFTEESQQLTPITTVGQDGASGVYLRFNLCLTEGCDVDDYPGQFDIEEPNINHTHCQ